MDAAVDIFCPECGYDLRGITSDRCPECGWTIDRDAAAAGGGLPWADAQSKLDGWRAYWRTVFIATFRIRRAAAAEMLRPVEQLGSSHHRARRFATITSLFAGIALTGALLALMAHERGTNFLNPIPASVPFNVTPLSAADATLPYAAGVTAWPVLPIGVVISFWLIARTPPMWFAFRKEHESDERRRRAMTLAYFTAAPLAYLPLGSVLSALSLLAASVDPSRNRSAMWSLAPVYAGIAIFVLCFCAFWFNALRLLRRTRHPTATRLAATGVALPVMWGACVAIGTVVFPWLVGFIWLMIDSLRA